MKIKFYKTSVIYPCSYVSKHEDDGRTSSLRAFRQPPISLNSNTFVSLYIYLNCF